jgi:hypothetical protein
MNSLKACMKMLDHRIATPNCTVVFGRDEGAEIPATRRWDRR